MTKKTAKKPKECLYCKINNKKARDKQFVMVALDRPYKNLWFHRSCLVKLGDGLNDFLIENRKIWDIKLFLG